jgi:mutator protein MutT
MTHGGNDARVTDNRSYRFAVSVKGVIVNSGKVVLLKNERDEWELPGGKLEPGETPEVCVAREIAEELGVSIDVGPLLDSWIYSIVPGVEVLILTYGIAALQDAVFTISNEHKALAQFAPSDIGALPMPDGYKASVRTWLQQV